MVARRLLHAAGFCNAIDIAFQTVCHLLTCCLNRVSICFISQRVGVDLTVHEPLFESRKICSAFLADWKTTPFMSSLLFVSCCGIVSYCVATVYLPGVFSRIRSFQTTPNSHHTTNSNISNNTNDTS